MGQFGSVEIVGQNRLIVVALCTHNGCSNLAKSYTMSPTGSSQGKLGRNLFYILGVGFCFLAPLFVHYKG